MPARRVFQLEMAREPSCRLSSRLDRALARNSPASARVWREARYNVEHYGSLIPAAARNAREKFVRRLAGLSWQHLLYVPTWPMASKQYRHLVGEQPVFSSSWRRRASGDEGNQRACYFGNGERCLSSCSCVQALPGRVPISASEPRALLNNGGGQLSLAASGWHAQMRSAAST